MKQKTMKRLTALVLALAMCLSLVSANVWAGDTSGDGSGSMQNVEEESAEETAQEEESEQVPVAPDVPEEVKQPETEKPKREKNSKLETQEIVASGNCGAQGANVTWTLDDEGTLTIRGSGAMTSHRYLDNYSGTIQTVVIKDGVTSIVGSAFYECSYLTSITIPDSVTTIGSSAFYKCSSLTSINIPDNVTSIGYETFAYCSSLTSITIPDSVTTFGNYTFYNCSSLTSVTIPDTATAIWFGAFSKCSSLTSINIPDGVTSIGNGAFYECSSLTSLTIPDSVTSIGESAFMYCSSLTSINIPDGVTSIGYQTFNNCSSLTSITIPDSVTTIGAFAFADCSSLTSLTIGNGVTSIGECAFVYCSNLTNITIGNGVTSIGECAFECCSSIESISIPNSVTSIGAYAFKSCNGLTGITIPDSVTSIGEDAFRDCSNLTEIYFYGNALYIGAWCFYNVTATAFYPANNPTWIDWMDSSHPTNGNSITWKEWVPGEYPVVDVHKDVPSYSGRFTFTTELESGNGKVEVEKTEDCEYMDSYFTNPSDEYNHALAKMSLALAMSAFNSPEGVKLNARPDAGKYTYRNPDSTYALENTRAKNVANLLYECGFGHIRVNQDYLVTTRYLVVPGQESVNDGNNIGVCIGSKKLDDEYTLIAVALRGAGYGDEWIGNFNAYNTGGSFHPGFKRASNKALTEILNYIQNQKITGKVKVWITGYSRSGATANLTAAKLCENNYDVITLRSDDVYAYTFEAPQGTKDKNADDEKYDGIWNIVNQIDPVPKVAMTKWGYLRYGQDVYLPCQYTNSKVYNQYKNKVLKQFNQYQEEGYLTLPHILNQMKNINTLVDGFAGLLGSDSTNRTRTSLYLIQKSFVDKAQSGAKELTFTEGLYDAFFKLLNNFNFAESVALESSVNQIKNQLEAVVISHYPTMTLAWMMTVPESAMSGTGGMCRYVRANCPVDLSVYDEDGVLQARIIDDTVYPEEDATIEAEVDADGQKVVTVPGDANVTIKVNATDNGIFNYSVSEYDSEKEESTKILNYYDIPILNGSELDAVIQDEECNESTRYQLMVQDSQIQPSEQLTGAEIENYNVTVRAKGSGTVIGTSTKTKGEFAMVTATPNEGGEFLGWYEGDNLVSQEANYRFRVERNVTLMARFTILPTLGDLNFDGEFTMADVVLLNRYVLGKNSLTPEQLALGDVTGDGDVTMADVVKLNRYVVGLIKSL